MKCMDCGNESRQSRCNLCLRKWRRINNYLKQLAWVLDQRGGKCEFCGEKIELVCDFEIHHFGENSWSKFQPNGSKSQESLGSYNHKLKEINQWMVIGKMPDDVLILCHKCHKRLGIIDDLEVLRYYPNSIIKSKFNTLVRKQFELNYNPYERAKEVRKNNSLEKNAEETKRISFMKEGDRAKVHRNL